jgi:hypothetical protein
MSRPLAETIPAVTVPRAKQVADRAQSPILALPAEASQTKIRTASTLVKASQSEHLSITFAV